MYEIAKFIQQFTGNVDTGSIELMILASTIISVGIIVGSIYWIGSRLINKLNQLYEIEQQAFGPLIQTDRKRKLIKFVQMDQVAFFFKDRQSRNNLLVNLPNGLASQIERSDIPTLDMQNIINTSANWGKDSFVTLCESIEQSLGESSDAQKIYQSIKKSLGGPN